jgi:prepilin-type N-terminal cleavage/methylation domain-containing protein
MRLRQAFTLVELLVVIAIIAVLISVLLPALQAARQQALSIQCLSNMRTVGQAIYMYANQNKGMIPPASLDDVEQIVQGANPIKSGSTGTGEVSTGVLYPNIKYALDRILNSGHSPWVSGNYDAGNMVVFYCPANFFWDNDIPGGTGPNLSHWPQDFMASRGRIKYWYVGNPNPLYPLYHYRGTFPVMNNSQAGIAGSVDWRWWDRNNSGDNRDDYMVKLGDKNVTNIVIMTDQSRQGTSTNATKFGFQFIHGFRTSGRLTGWKNNLYGDGHAASVRAKLSSFSPDASVYTNPNPSHDELQPGYGPVNSGSGSGEMLW